MPTAPSQRYRDHISLFGQSGDYITGLLTISSLQDGVLPEPIRLNSTTDRNILSRGETFFASGFDWRMPNKEGGEVRSTFAIPVADRTILAALRATHVKFQFRLEVVLSGTVEVVEFFFKLVEKSKHYDTATQCLYIEAQYRDVMSSPRPRKRYSPRKFPALFGRASEPIV